MQRDTRFLRQPRGAGKGFSFKMPTPPALVGQPNPRTEKPYGKTIHEGLNTRDPREARRRRDLLLGQIRAEEARATGESRVSDEAAKAIAEMRRKDGPLVYSGSGDERSPDPDLEDTLIRDQAEEVGERRGDVAASRWLEVAKGEATLFADAMDQYREERKSDMKRTTLDSLLTERRRFIAWAGEGVTLQEVDRAMVHRYLVKHMPTVTSPKSPQGMSRSSIQRAQTLMKGLWDWARSCGILDFEARNPWSEHRLPKARASTSAASLQESPQGFSGNAGEDFARMYGPEEWNRLAEAIPAGGALGDALRLAMATGCRLSEIIERTVGEIERCGSSVAALNGRHTAISLTGTETPGEPTAPAHELHSATASGLLIPSGKTVNARRYAPVLVGTEAHEVLERRSDVGGVSRERRELLFHDVHARTTADRPNSVLSKEFGRLRRKILGVESNNRLNFHSTRHTWRTMARRAGLDLDTVADLGGWAGRAGTDRQTYDWGLAREQLREASRKVIQRFREEGYRV